MRRRGFGALACALLLVRCGTPEGPLEIKLGHVGAPGSLFAVSAEEFARRANERLGEQARVVVFGSSQLGGDDLMLQKLKLGALELALPSSILSSRVADFGLFDMPYLVDDRDHMRRIEEEVVWPRLAPLAEQAGYTMLAVWENGFRHVTNNVRPVRTPGDLAGIKLRTPRGEWRVRMFRSWGANPTPMALSEVFVALQTGVMDGQENPIAQIRASRLHEVQRYLSLTRHVYTPAYLTAGSRRWQELPPEVREILERTARETREFVYATAETMDRELLDELRESGIEVNEVDREAFRAASQPIYEEFAAEVRAGEEMLSLSRGLAPPASDP